MLVHLVRIGRISYSDQLLVPLQSTKSTMSNGLLQYLFLLPFWNEISPVRSVYLILNAICSVNIVTNKKKNRFISEKEVMATYQLWWRRIYVYAPYDRLTIPIADSVSKSYRQQSMKFVIQFSLPFVCKKKIICRSHILQADSAEILHQWISALHKGIGAAINCGQLNKLDQLTPVGSLPGASNFKKMWGNFLFSVMHAIVIPHLLTNPIFFCLVTGSNSWKYPEIRSAAIVDIQNRVGLPLTLASRYALHVRVYIEVSAYITAKSDR